MEFPGPAALGRGIVVAPGADLPPGWDQATRVRVDDDTLAAPGPASDVLHRCWSTRQRMVVELDVDAAELKRPQTEDRPPYLLDAGFDFPRDRLHFLVWANTYDARQGPPVWWHGVRAARVGASEGGPADVILSDGTPAWCDGGPRQSFDLPEAVVHRDSIDAGGLQPGRRRPSPAALAPDQRAAVEHPGGPARIIAPAGSGKTRVLTERLRHLIADRGHEANLVTAVAYNVKAADELRERTQGLSPTIRTLNSLGLRICELAGPVRVIEEMDARRIVESLVHINRRTNTDPVAPYLEALSAIRLGLIDPEDAEARFPDATGVAAALPAYRAALADRGAVDFDEQIYRAVELCLQDPGVRTAARAGAKTLLVDEFQDLTPAHVLLLRLLAGPAASVFGVGDDDQVIYGYAGADPGFLIDFGRYFPGAASYDLTINYRCPVAVVRAATTLLTHNRRRLPKTVTAAPGRGESARELAVESVDGDRLAPAAVERIRAWTDDGAAPADIAVLSRVNSVLLPVQVALFEAGIPCTRPLGAELLSRTGMTAALAYLRMGLEPDRVSRGDVLATVRRPSRRIARNVVDMITKRPSTSVDDLRRLSDWLSGDDAERVAAYAGDIEAVATAVTKGTTAQALAVIAQEVGLSRALATLDASKGGERSTHGDDMWALEQVAALHPDPATFEAWLRECLSGRSGDGVQLSTVHKVKGREWPLVIVFGASAGLFPHRLADDREEERRVFHVAITRSRDRVVVLADAGAPSPFIAQLTQPRSSDAIHDIDDEPEPEPQRQRPTSKPTAGVTTGNLAAFEALREWRSDRARQDQVPAYIVMSDAHLRAIAERAPASLVELSGCPGIGPVKLDRYGDEILSVLAALASAR